MALEKFRAPALNNATPQYDQQAMQQLVQVLRIYFNQLDSDTANKAYSYRTNGIIFNPDGLPDMQTGQMAWDSTNETVAIALANGVLMQIGQEWYARVQNNTGVTIPNGTVVGFAGATNDALLVQPYIANGSMPSLYILGVMTHDLPDSGDKGLATVWGFVHDLNTSMFSPGDILYASPTVAGGLTNVKPTAPNKVIPVAAVAVSNATVGAIFVRPTIEQDLYYGTFSDSTTQSPSAIYTPKAITFNATDISDGISRGAPTSRIVTAHSGFYNFQFSAQVQSGNASIKRLWIWIRKNGVDVLNSNTEITVSGSGTVLVPAWNWTLSMAANDYFEMWFAADDTNVHLLAVAAQTGANGTPTFARPAVPSMILTVTQVQQ